VHFAGYLAVPTCRIDMTTELAGKLAGVVAVAVTVASLIAMSERS
jgi:hypothetical protein